MLDKYQTAAEYAASRGLSKQRICALCRQRRIPGAQRLGAAWMIPAGATISPPHGNTGPSTWRVPVDVQKGIEK